MAQPTYDSWVVRNQVVIHMPETEGTKRYESDSTTATPKMWTQLKSPNSVLNLQVLAGISRMFFKQSDLTIET